SASLRGGEGRETRGRRKTKRKAGPVLARALRWGGPGDEGAAGREVPGGESRGMLFGLVRAFRRARMRRRAPRERRDRQGARARGPLAGFVACVGDLRRASRGSSKAENELAPPLVGRSENVCRRRGASGGPRNSSSSLRGPS